MNSIRNKVSHWSGDVPGAIKHPPGCSKTSSSLSWSPGPSARESAERDRRSLICRRRGMTSSLHHSWRGVAVNSDVFMEPSIRSAPHCVCCWEPEEGQCRVCCWSDDRFPRNVRAAASEDEHKKLHRCWSKQLQNKWYKLKNEINI